jgi:hypothetical protein
MLHFSNLLLVNVTLYKFTVGKTMNWPSLRFAKAGPCGHVGHISNTLILLGKKIVVRNKLITLQLQIVNNKTLLTVQHEKFTRYICVEQRSARWPLWPQL